MKLEQQVCSLELAKQLKKLGVKQDSYFPWYQGPRAEWHLGDTAEMMNEAVDVSHTTAPQFFSASAFTVAELGELLPEEVETGVGGMSSGLLFLTKGTWENGDRWQAMYYDLQLFNAPTEAEARAKMLIYLIENNYITV